MSIPPIPTNPANNTKASTRGDRKRIPLSIPRRKLEVPEIPGFRLYWFMDSRVQAAIQGGYDFVTSDEIPTYHGNVAGDNSLAGNADLGSHVKVVAGNSADSGHLILMKIREEWFAEDQKVLEEQNAKTLGAIFREEKVLGSEQQSAKDRETTYVKTALLNRPTRRGK